MKSGIQLRKDQMRMVKKAIKVLDEGSYFFAEAPTGWGKSVTIGEMAKHFVKEGKKVFISTFSNKLVYDLYQTYQKYFYDNENTSILVGKENYYNPLLLLNPLIYEIIPEEKIRKFLDEINCIPEELDLPFYDKKEFLFEYLFDSFDLKEDDKYVIKEICKVTAPIEKEDFDLLISSKDIFFTNHAYLYSILFHRKKSFKDNYVVIFDEFHTVESVLESMIKKTFSPFRLKNLIATFQKGCKVNGDWLKVKGIKTVKKELKGMSQGLQFFLENFSGIQAQKASKEEMMFVLSNVIINNRKGILDKIDNILKRNNCSNQLKTILYLIKKECIEYITIKDSKDVYINFSKVRKFPSFDTYSTNVEQALSFLWKNIDNVIGISATMILSGPDAQAHNIIYKKFHIPDTKTKYGIFEFGDSYVNKDNIHIYLPDKDFPKPEIIETEDDILVNELWAKMVADVVRLTFDYKNTLILTGSYKEVDAIDYYLTTCFEEKNIKFPIIRAEIGTTMENKVKAFKKTGGILIGTRNYGVGIDLPGEQLERLYIAKLPYPVKADRKWVELAKRSQKTAYFQMLNEMLLNLRQWAGRLRRTKNDKGEIYLLDARIFTNPTVEESTKKVLDRIGVIKKIGWNNPEKITDRISVGMR